MRAFLLLLLCASIAAGVTLAVASPPKQAAKPTQAKRAATTRNARQKLHKVNSQIREVREQKRTAEVRERTFALRLQDTQQQLSETKDRIETAEARLRDAVTRFQQVKAQLEFVRARLEQRNRLLSRRLVALQRSGQVPYAAVLFRSADYWDYLSRKRLMSRVVSYDVQLVNAIREDERDVAQWKSRLEERAGEQRQIVGYLDDQRTLREGLRSSQASQLDAASREASRYEQMLAELEANSDQIASFIRRLEATPTGRVRAARRFQGGFWRPCNGPISSSFGMRFHPILKRTKLHTGVDFSAAQGTPVRAAARGEVIHSGWWGAYGNAVIIDHGGGVTTLYGHLSSIAVGNGGSVTRGTVVGRVGNTGWSTGPHLHYEVRRNGVPVNPLGQF